MFDRTFITPDRDVHHYHRVETTEKRAPTDESVKLLREMEEAARKNVLDSFRIEAGNLIEGRILVQRESYDWKTKAVALFSINGTKLEAIIEIDGMTGDTKDKADMLALLRDEIAMVIANHLMKGMIGKLGTIRDLERRGG